MNPVEKPVYDEEGVNITRLHDQFHSYLETKMREVEEQRLSRRYYHGDQWGSEQLKELKRRNQMPTITPAYAQKLNGFAGMITAMRTDPKASGRTPQHGQGAELVTAALRYVDDDQDIDLIAGHVALGLGIDAIAVVEINLEKSDSSDPRDYDISLEIVPSDTFFYDPVSIRPDFSDAKYMGVSKWFDIEDAKDQFAEYADELDATVTGGSEFEINSDRQFQWTRRDRKQILIVEHWYRRGGEWHWCFYTNSTKLGSGRAYVQDEKGRDICRFIPVSMAVDHEGDRYTFFRHMKTVVDEINQRNSKALHLLSTRRIFAETGAFEDIEKARREAVKPDGVVIYNTGTRAEFEDGKSLADMNGQLSMMQNSMQVLQNFGPNPALVGQGVEARSGRAIALMQQAGIAELGPYIAAFKSWKIRLYKAIWSAIRTYWTAERWIRVTDAQGLPVPVQINGVQSGPYGPQLVNAFGNVGVDIIIDEGPDHVNMQADALEVLQAAQAQGQQIPPEVMLELLPIHDTLKKRLTGMISEARQSPPPELVVMDAKMKADAVKQQADIEAELLKERERGAIELEAKRADLELERERLAIQVQMHREKLSADIEAKRELAMIDRQTKIDLAGMQAEAASNFADI